MEKEEEEPGESLKNIFGFENFIREKTIYTFKISFLFSVFYFSMQEKTCYGH